MMKKKYILPIVGAIIVLTAFVFTKLTLAYLVDTETSNNVITVGKVALKIDEGGFKNESVIAEGQKLLKAPKIINTGTKDEYVFFKVSVPKGNVTLLYDTDTTINNTEHKEGSKIGDKAVSELFKILASTPSVSSIPDSNNPQKVVFEYHSGDSTSENKHTGWIYLDTKTDTTNSSYDYYYFGYNKKLIAGKDSTTNSTVTLFDQIQLKSFIDEELGNNNNVQVDVTAYGIQADELGITISEDYLNKEQLTTIWEILERKSVSTNAGT